MMIKSDGNGKIKVAWLGLFATIILVALSFAAGYGAKTEKINHNTERICALEKNNEIIYEMRNDIKWIKEKLQQK
jgi:hypothetical protein